MGIGISEKKVKQSKILPKDVTSRTSWIYRYYDVFYDIEENWNMITGWYKCAVEGCTYFVSVNLSERGNWDLQRHLTNVHKDLNLNKAKLKSSKGQVENYNISMKRYEMEIFISLLLEIGSEHGVVDMDRIVELFPEVPENFNCRTILQDIEEKAKALSSKQCRVHLDKLAGEFELNIIIQLNTP